MSAAILHHKYSSTMSKTLFQVVILALPRQSGSMSKPITSIIIENACPPPLKSCSLNLNLEMYNTKRCTATTWSQWTRHHSKMDDKNELRVFKLQSFIFIFMHPPSKTCSLNFWSWKFTIRYGYYDRVPVNCSHQSKMEEWNEQRVFKLQSFIFMTV